jgi:formylglycine-generating enzyme required for sulfatase activity
MRRQFFGARSTANQSRHGSPIAVSGAANDAVRVPVACSHKPDIVRDRARPLGRVLMRRFVIFLFGLVWFSQAAVQAQQAGRIALLIGNQGYNARVGALRNPHKDIALLGAALEKLGFRTTMVRDADYRAIDIALKVHLQEVRVAGPGTISFFYYSGHGAAQPGSSVNYLIPVDVLDADDEHLWDQSFELTDIIGRLRTQGSNATHYIVFDACRDELRLRGQKSLGMTKGFVPVENVTGVMVAYSTAPGKTASDGGRNGGPYALALAEEVVRPGIEAVEMFRNVQRRVNRTIGQDPWLSFPTLPSIYFAGPEIKPISSPAAVRLSEAAQIWPDVKTTTNRSILEAFIKQFPDTVYAAMARARLEELTVASIPLPSEAAAPPSLKSDPAASSSTSVPMPAPKIEQGADRPSSSSPPPSSSPRQEKEPVQTSSTVSPEPPRDPGCTGIEIATGIANNRRCVQVGSDKATWFSDCTECPQMVVVPGGSFRMGSPLGEPGRSNESEEFVDVKIGRPFAIGRFAVTRGEFATFVRATNHKTGGGCSSWEGSDFTSQPDRSWRSPGFAQDDHHPVVCVNWNDAKAYARWLSKTTGKDYRLPSEAMREYATRAGTSTAFWWGASITTERANYDGNYSYADGRKGDYRQKTVPVDSFKANGFGLFNVHGNVWEWTEDCWNVKNSDNPGNGSARTSGDCTYRVVRGGSWSSYPYYLRSGLRGRNDASTRAINYGFRVMRSL